MSGSNKETQAILLGVAAVAAAGLLYFAYSQPAEPATETKKLSSGDDDVVSKRSQETSKTSNTKKADEISAGDSKMDDKALHAAIEELDKKGKAYFKNKQVSETTVTNCGGYVVQRKRSQLPSFLPIDIVFASS